MKRMQTSPCSFTSKAIVCLVVCATVSVIIYGSISWDNDPSFVSNTSTMEQELVRGHRLLSSYSGEESPARDAIQAFLLKLGFESTEIQNCRVQPYETKIASRSRWGVYFEDFDADLTWDVSNMTPLSFRTTWADDPRRARVDGAIKTSDDALEWIKGFVRPYLDLARIQEEYLFFSDKWKYWGLDPWRREEFGEYYHGPSINVDAKTGYVLLFNFIVRSDKPM